MPIIPLKLLGTTQTEQFDVEYVNDYLWRQIAPWITPCLERQQAHCLDVGGGNGTFVDRLLRQFPNLSATIVEPAENLIRRNAPSPRKRLIPGTFQESRLERFAPFEVIFFNWVLHHFVGRSFAESVEAQQDALAQAQGLLSRDGVICILENYYEGALWHDLPTRLIFTATASRLLAPIAGKLGANTAGVGVCFHSERRWCELLARQGFELIGQRFCYEYSTMGRLMRAALTMTLRPRVGLLVARARRPASPSFIRAPARGAGAPVQPADSIRWAADSLRDGALGENPALLERPSHLVVPPLPHP